MMDDDDFFVVASSSNIDDDDDDDDDDERYILHIFKSKKSRCSYCSLLPAASFSVPLINYYYVDGEQGPRANGVVCSGDRETGGTSLHPHFSLLGLLGLLSDTVHTRSRSGSSERYSSQLTYFSCFCFYGSHTHCIAIHSPFPIVSQSTHIHSPL
jgi:hypothetical protein